MTAKLLYVYNERNEWESLLGFCGFSDVVSHQVKQETRNNMK